LKSEIVYDAILSGAGGAGLNLLLAMHKTGYLDNHRVLIIDPVRNNTNNRTWCFWAKPEERIVEELGSLIPEVWDFSSFGGHKHALHPYRYYHLRGIDFYNYVYQIIDNHKNVEWIFDSVNGVELMDDAVLINTKSSGIFWGEILFDSRISRNQINLNLDEFDIVWQSFFGYKVKISENLFDRDCVRLMDFSIDQNEQCQFVYLLPFSDNEALIELTRFGKDCLSSIEDNHLLENWILERFGAFEIIEKEEGRIPMTLVFNPEIEFHKENERVIPIGTAGGNVKSTTGYAFQAMFNHSFAIVSSLLQKKSIPTAYHSKRTSFYDSLLLDILDAKPFLGKEIFTRLFKKRPTPDVLTFLREETSLKEEIPILWSLPKKPFIIALIKRLFLPLHIKETDKSFFPLELTALVITFLFVILNLLDASLIKQLSPLFLLVGMIFPGIPHGALDHRIRLGNNFNPKKFALFIVFYVCIMLLVLAIWLLNAPLALFVFIVYSAWHFGETDFQRYGLKSSLGSFLSGFSLLIFILFSHFSEFASYLKAFDVNEYVFSPVNAIYISVTSAIVFVISGLMYLPRKFIPHFIVLAFTLALSIQLPLLLAFGIYFIGIHSFSGWNDVKIGLSENHSTLIKYALPFTLGAFFTMLVFSFVAMNFEWNLIDLIPTLFIALSCLSAPHVFVMSGFYKRIEKG
jgi:lycopene beta-cyclase